MAKRNALPGEPNAVLGSELPQALQKQALAAYVHRFTGDHRPAWADEQAKLGLVYHTQFRDDAEWLAHTLFPVSKDGTRLLSGQCYSQPTWPYGR